MGWVQSLFDSGLKEVQCQVKKQREVRGHAHRGGPESRCGHRTLLFSLSWIARGGGTETSAPRLTNILPPSNLFFMFLPQWPFWNGVREDSAEKVAFMLGHCGGQKKCPPSKMSTSWSPEPVRMFPYMPKGTLQTWFSQGSSDGTLSWIIWVAQCSHKSPFNRDTGKSERDVMTEAEVRMM